MRQLIDNTDITTDRPSVRQRIRSWLKNVVGLDKAISFTILGRGWGGLAGLVTVALIAKFLSPSQQGYYYTFGSLVALQVVFELGFSFVILQMASHEMAHLTISKDQRIGGDPVAHARLASVLKLTVRWYSIAALGMAVALIPAGSLFFRLHAQRGAPVAWQWPWYLDVVAAALTFLLDPILSFLEGCGYISQIASLRFAQGVAGSVFAWTTLVLHRGLFAPAMIMMGTVLVTVVWLFGKRRLIFGLLGQDVREHRVHWHKEIWPFQWRIAISWLCGYFIFQLFNPVLFVYQGPIVAGQMGMSLTIASALQAVAISWINTKRAPFGGLIAKKDYGTLDRIFFRTLLQSVTVCVIGATAIFLIISVLNVLHLPFAHRLLAPLPFSLLLLATIVNITVFAEALYLRAHKQEKFLGISVINGILTGLSTYLLGKYFGVTAVVLAYLLINLFAGLGLGTFTFFKYRRLWHES